jgi:DNA-binding NtrC family response regulator
VKVLIVDDQRSARRVLKHMLAPLDDLEIVEAGTLDEAKEAVQREHVDLALIDIRLSNAPTDRGGLEFLCWMRKGGRATPAVMVTASTELAEIREAMRQGAQDYVLKDELSPEMILPIVEGMRERALLRGEVHRLREQVDRSWGLASLIGSSEAMERVRGLVERVAPSDVPVLVLGPTGTGKERVARAIHEMSDRPGRFVAVNCAALPATLIESMLFGHERGACTGAVRRTRGHFEMADQGTLLLDEIGEMPVELQAKLLRALEDKTFTPLGANHEQPLRARVIAATLARLEQRIAEGRFREDLFYRLNVVSIHLPPLAERADDIPELLQGFMADLTRRLHFSDEAIGWLKRRDYPGNVRELRNLVDRLALLSPSDDVDIAILEELVGGELRAIAGADEIDKMAKAILLLPSRLGSKLDVIERAILHHAIEVCGGNKSAAARLVGVQRKSLERRWERLSEPDVEDD